MCLGEWTCGVIVCGDERDKKRERGERGIVDIILIIGVNCGVDVGVSSSVPTPFVFRDEAEDSKVEIAASRPTCWKADRFL